MDRLNQGFEIESTSYCQTGFSPRWSWWIRGIAGTARYGIVGTDEYGTGLYLYGYDSAHQQTRELLLPAERFSLTEEVPRTMANEMVTRALTDIGWLHAGDPFDRGNLNTPRRGRQ